MLIHVRYYAVLREVTGLSGESIELPEGSDGRTLLQAVMNRHAGVATYASVVRLATDSEYLENAAILAPESVISLIPPVSGG